MSDRITLRRRVLTPDDRDELIAPGEWAIVGKSEDFRVVESRCGGCSRRQTIGQRHSIGPDGMVNPSYVCAFECGWHVWVVLEGWDLPGKPLGATAL